MTFFLFECIIMKVRIQDYLEGRKDPPLKSCNFAVVQNLTGSFNFEKQFGYMIKAHRMCNLKSINL